MTLAQNTDIILLDKPINHLNIKYRIEILDLLSNLNKLEERPIIIVLHDINLACRHANHIITLKNGQVYRQGSPKEIFDNSFIKDFLI